MAEFVQTMKDWKRMCNAMGQEDEYTACDKCDLRSFGCPAIYAKECDYADWDHVENVVTAWAAEHQEQVYPTWYEFMRENKIIPDVLEDCGDYYKTIGKWLVKATIKHDIAEKLGVEPKEG